MVCHWIDVPRASAGFGTGTEGRFWGKHRTATPVDVTAPTPREGTVAGHLTDEQHRVIHTITDLETARTAGIRASDAARLLLEDAIHAHANGYPDVVAEYLERALGHTNKALAALRNKEGS